MEILRKSELFRGLSDEQLQSALTFFDAQERAYPRGAVLKGALDPLTAFGLVLRGSVTVSMNDIDGHSMLLAHVAQGQTFGESLCYLHENAPIHIEAATDARVLWMRCEGMHAAEHPLHDEMQRRFTAMLAQRTLKMNDRIQILSRASIRDKLTAFFTECARDAGSNTFTIPFDRAGMAAYLGVDRSALSRELSRMREQGVVDYHKNAFRLLKS